MPQRPHDGPKEWPTLTRVSLEVGGTYTCGQHPLPATGACAVRAWQGATRVCVQDASLRGRPCQHLLAHGVLACRACPQAAQGAADQRLGLRSPPQRALTLAWAAYQSTPLHARRRRRSRRSGRPAGRRRERRPGCRRWRPQCAVIGGGWRQRSWSLRDSAGGEHYRLGMAQRVAHG